MKWKESSGVLLTSWSREVLRKLVAVDEPVGDKQHRDYVIVFV